MLRFFRQIRQQLFKDLPAQGSLAGNRVRQYSLYAIGEILLVVIGILIALQINNWNQNRLDHLKSIKILKEIKRDVQENVNLTQQNIQFDKNVIQSIDIIFHNLNQVKEYHDSLDLHFFRSHIWPEVNIKSSGYETLKSNGIDLIQSDTLKEAILDFYEVAYNKILEVTRISEGNSFSTVVPIQTDLFLPRSKTGYSHKPFDYQKVLDSIKYKGVLGYCRTLRVLGISRREFAIRRGEHLIKLIHQEIQN